VARVQSALHVRTGQRTSAVALDAWLSRHEVAVVGVEDVYEACVYLLKNYEQVPDLVLIGMDGLAEDEAAIIGRVRDTWPRAGIVIYGRPGAFAVPCVAPPVQVCCTTEALDRLLSQTPAQLLGAMDLPSRSWSDVSAPPSKAERLEGRVQPTGRRNRDEEVSGADDRPLPLTREELAALLDDPEDS